MPHISNVAGIGIGFENLTYTVIEGSELEVEVCARVGTGILVTDVIATIHTEPGTATTTTGMSTALLGNAHTCQCILCLQCH